MLKAIIFDMDDTLIDWSQRTQNWQEYENNYLTRVFEYLMSKIESPATVDEFIVAVRQHTEKAWLASGPELHAPNFLAILEQAFASLGVNLKRLDIETRLRNFDWELSPGVGAYPDVEELLPVLVSHNIKIGMITNAHYPMWMRDRELQAYGLLAHFADCRLSSADVGFLKPHPAIFKAALDCLGARPDEAIFIGDNPEADIAGAQAVGMRGVLRVGPNAPPLISGLIIPDGAINSLHELMPLLDKWYPGWRAGDDVNLPTQQTSRERRMALPLPTPYRNLILTGQIGVGRVTIGRLLAAQTGATFLDFDTELQLREGLPAEEIRQLFGEARLRTLEDDLCREISLRRSAVLSVNGPTLLEDANRARLANSGPILILTCELNEILRRMHSSQGARFHDPKVRSAALYQIRRERLILGIAGLPTLGTTELSVEEVAEHALQFWRQTDVQSA